MTAFSHLRFLPFKCLVYVSSRHKPSHILISNLVNSSVHGTGPLVVSTLQSVISSLTTEVSRYFFLSPQTQRHTTCSENSLGSDTQEQFYALRNTLGSIYPLFPTKNKGPHIIVRLLLLKLTTLAAVPAGASHGHVYGLAYTIPHLWVSWAPVFSSSPPIYNPC